MRAQPIIEALGGLSAAARKIGAPVSTVQHWRDTDAIPEWRSDQVRRAIEAEGLDWPVETAA